MLENTGKSPFSTEICDADVKPSPRHQKVQPVCDLLEHSVDSRCLPKQPWQRLRSCLRNACRVGEEEARARTLAKNQAVVKQGQLSTMIRDSNHVYTPEVCGWYPTPQLW